MNSSADGWVNGIGSGGGFERLNRGSFYLFIYEFDSCTTCLCGFITFSLFFLHNFCFVKGNRVLKKKVKSLFFNEKKKLKVFFFNAKKKSLVLIKKKRKKEKKHGVMLSLKINCIYQKKKKKKSTVLRCGS